MDKHLQFISLVNGKIQSEPAGSLYEAAPALFEALSLVWDSTAVLNHLDSEALQIISNAMAKAKGE